MLDFAAQEDGNTEWDDIYWLTGAKGLSIEGMNWKSKKDVGDASSTA